MTARIDCDANAATELLLVWIEAECAAMKPEKRLRTLRRAAAIFERLQDRENVMRIRENAAEDKAAQRSAHQTFKDALPRLLYPTP